MKKTISVFATAAIMITACNNNQTPSDANKEQTVDTIAASNEEEVKIITHRFTTVDANVYKHINGIIESYLTIKDNLVKSDALATAKAAMGLEKTLEGFDKSLLTEEQKKVYDKYIPELQKQAAAISSEKDVKKQREAFAPLTESVYELSKAFGYNKSLFHEHCPMALGNGAMWLSTEKEIKNPYFGDEMLDCGSVMEEVK
jgi:hypothetical protein